MLMASEKGNVSEWLKAQPEYEKYAESFKFTDWEQIIKFERQELEDIGLDNSDIDIVSEKLSKRIKELGLAPASAFWEDIKKKTAEVIPSISYHLLRNIIMIISKII